MFTDISIIGRVAWGIFALEVYLKECNENMDMWKGLFEKLWSFPYMEYVDEYTYMFIEHSPYSILECDNYIQDGDWEYVSEEEFFALRELYTTSEHTQETEYVMDCLQEMLSTHLYTQNTPPAKASLDIMNTRLYLYLADRIKSLPPIEPFKIYSVQDNKCWGCFHSKEGVLGGQEG